MRENAPKQSVSEIPLTDLESKLNHVLWLAHVYHRGTGWTPRISNGSSIIRELFPEYCYRNPGD